MSRLPKPIPPMILATAGGYVVQADGHAEERYATQAEAVARARALYAEACDEWREEAQSHDLEDRMDSLL